MSRFYCFLIIFSFLFSTSRILSQYDYAVNKEFNSKQDANELESRQEIKIGRTGEETAENMDAYMNQYVDESNYGQLTAFDAGPNGVDLKRFRSSPCYEKIGFDPSLDLEVLLEAYEACEANNEKNNLYRIGFVSMFLLVTIVAIILGIRDPRKASSNTMKSSYTIHQNNSTYQNYNPNYYKQNSESNKEIKLIPQNIKNYFSENLTSNQKYGALVLLLIVGFPLLLLLIKFLFLE